MPVSSVPVQSLNGRSESSVQYPASPNLARGVCTVSGYNEYQRHLLPLRCSRVYHGHSSRGLTIYWTWAPVVYGVSCSL